MLYRKVWEDLERFYDSRERKALLITGARQVGKTYIIEAFGKRYRSFVRINFIENALAVSLFENATDAANLLTRISALSDQELIPGETLIFLDEVQRCPEIVTAIKFLVEEGSYQYILSGSMLGVELKDIRSVPVGYMDVLEMYPLDFEEFLLANRLSRSVIDALRACFDEKKPVDALVHEKLMELFRLYLIVGGMPAVVDKYVRTNNLREVVREQQGIVATYKRDIGQYDPNDKLYLEAIFELIPSELNSRNKRFILKNLNENRRFSRFEHSFIWLRDAGVAWPAYCANEPRVPLLLSKSTNLFKLFMNDVGLLASMYMADIQLRILNREKDINFGSVYENAVAQELKAHGFELFYFNSKKQGELDFLVERDGEVLPIEVKSGKDYAKHAALNNVMANEEYAIPEACVLYNGNVEVRDRVTYMPVYMAMFIRKKALPDQMIYRVDLAGLTE